MQSLFRYNWIVRDEWFELLRQLPEEELTRTRMGGVGSFLRTMAHIVDVEDSWLRGLRGLPDEPFDYDRYPTLEDAKAFSDMCRPGVEDFVNAWMDEMENEMLEQFAFGEVMRHVIAHEIHHIGQLSIWAREIGLKPPSANFIGRGLAKNG
ncbi:DinB family protein [Paenibacillus methanolicus]|uniref:Putative damage-inducible protein DinB n=1 Tax=Paenibacillus methanolicus TaxID=582686 RepID=A0A5S5BWM9_9BACL|nr:DinB family protein [Paenibacillus methanolicus]TYP70708.1 putative damage-inducible protein DinB [Paenibacillus methanolicus]